MKVIISGGGSGGHIYPAIAIADQLKKEIKNIQILFVGAKGKMEMEKIPKAGYPIEGLWISGIQRKLTLRNLMFPCKLIVSLWKSWGIIKDYKPELVIGVGGFASGPLLKVATWSNIPTMIQEQNSYPGITNRLLSKQVDKICVAYDGLSKFFPKSKIVFTGNPLRSKIYKASMSKMEAADKFGLDADKHTILVVGGSLGARSLNEAMEANLPSIAKKSKVQWIWQLGKSYYDEYLTRIECPDHVKMLSFIDDMDAAYKLADLVVCRAGALTISEMALLGQAAILVPSLNVAEDHQTANAQKLTDKNAAMMIADSDIKQKIFDISIELVMNEEKLEQFRERILAFAKPEAAKDIVKEAKKLLRK